MPSGRPVRAAAAVAKERLNTANGTQKKSQGPSGADKDTKAQQPEAMKAKAGEQPAGEQPEDKKDEAKGKDADEASTMPLPDKVSDLHVRQGRVGSAHRTGAGGAGP
jgi:hypothetical protein